MLAFQNADLFIYARFSEQECTKYFEYVLINRGVLAAQMAKNL